MYAFYHATAFIRISGSWHQKMASWSRAPEKLQKLIFNFVLQFRCKHGESRGGWKTTVQKITHLHAAFSWLVVFAFLLHPLSRLCSPSMSFIVFFTTYQPSQSPCPHLSGSLTNASSCCFFLHSLLSLSLCLSPLSPWHWFSFFELWPGPKSPLLQLTQPILQPLRGGQSIQQVEWWSSTPLYPVKGNRSRH